MAVMLLRFQVNSWKVVSNYHVRLKLQGARVNKMSSEGKLLMNGNMNFRRKFLGGLAGLWAAKYASAGQETQAPSAGAFQLPEYALAQNYRSLKQSSYDRSGGNNDRWPIAPGETKEVFNANGPGVISHIWFT